MKKNFLSLIKVEKVCLNKIWINFAIYVILYFHISIFWQSSETESDPVNSFSRIISILWATLGMAGTSPGSPGRVLLLKLLILTFFV